MHADLELTALIRRRIGISPRALTIDGNGRLAVLDGVSEEDNLAKAKKLLDYERAAFQDLLKKEEEDEDRRLGSRFDDDDRGTARRGKGKKKKAGKRKANPIRKKGRRKRR